MENYKEKLPHRLRRDAEKTAQRLAETVETYKKSLELLQGIKRLHKKDGSDFQNVLKNFETPQGACISWGYVITTKYVEISARPLPKISLERHDIGDELTADEIEAEIQKHIEKYKGRIAEAENNAQRFGGELDELAKITEKLGEFLDGLQSENDYKLRDLLKNAL